MAREFTRESINSLIKNNNKLPLALTLLLALVAALYIFNAIFRPAPMITWSPPLPTNTPGATTTHTPDLAHFHLFGQYKNKSSALPQTTLQLTLEGVAMATDALESRAIISSSGKYKIYSVGDIVPGGAVIKAIDRTQVTLEQDHQLTSLTLPIPKLTMQNGVYSSASPH